MRKIAAVAILVLCAPFGVQAQEQAAEPAVIQLFACKLQDGKTMENVWGLADAFRNGINSLESNDEGAAAFLWTSFRGATPYDYIMGFVNSNLKSMVEALSNYYSSGVGAGLDAQFGATGDCISAIVFSEQIKNGDIGNTGDHELDAVVETFGCTINQGSDMDDIRSASQFWLEQVMALNSAATNGYEAYLWTPYRGGTGQSDFMWVGNYRDYAAWAQGDTEYYASKQGQAADARFNKVSTCGSALWNGYWIVPPAAGPSAG